jgi:hypothetical protein
MKSKFTEEGDEKLNITIRIRDPLVGLYYSNREIFRTSSSAATVAAEIYPYLREKLLYTVKGVFDEKELNLLLQIFKLEKSPTFMTSKEILIHTVKEKVNLLDSEQFKQDIVDGIISKIEKLEDFIVIVFTEWLATFCLYNVKFAGRRKFDIKIESKNYLKKLFKKP